VFGAPIHLKPAAELAERVLLPGDPHRALAVAQELLERPRMFNHHRGLWGYTGEARDGQPLSIQSTGMGGPSAAIVVEELIGLGARTLIRIGTCGALAPELRLGELIVADEVIGADGASRSLGAGERLRPAPALTAALAESADARTGTVVSTDVFYERRPEAAVGWIADGALAVEMEAAALVQVASLHGVDAACVLAVSDLVGSERARIDADELEAVGVRLGEVAYAALATASRRP
jgi:DeoD family purine-nucleoside phosphorylase